MSHTSILPYVTLPCVQPARPYERPEAARREITGRYVIPYPAYAVPVYTTGSDDSLDP